MEEKDTRSGNVPRRMKGAERKKWHHYEQYGKR